MATRKPAAPKVEPEAVEPDVAEEVEAAEVPTSEDPLRAALERELAGYKARGLDDRAKAVRAEIAKL